MATAFKDIKAVPLQRVARGLPGGTPAEKAPDPSYPAMRIPKGRYTSADFMKMEWERMWTKVWNLAGSLQYIPEPGDWFTTELGRESFIFVRQDDGGVKGFFNVCLHRGNRLCPLSEVGHGQTFKCGYHHWEWRKDGVMHRLPDQETFPHIQSLKGMELKEVRTGTWGGMVWFCMDPNGMSLDDYLGMIPEHLNPYRFEDQKLIDSKTIEWDCNWKTSVDAFNETYHVQGIHPELLSWLDDYNVQIDCYERHNRYLVPFTTPSPHYADQSALSGEMQYFAQLAGVNPADFEGRPRELRLAIQKAKRALQDSTIYPYKLLNDDQLSDDYHYMIFPNVTLNVYGETMLLFRSRPHPSDPNKMLYDLMNFAHLPPEQPHQLPEHQTYKHGQISLGLVLDQDAYNLPRVQEGMNSMAYDGLILGDQELRIKHFHATLMDYVDPDGSLGV
jgi:phenylpropionate dioxygenase-like ring-hydroxylating dioxygenase large terminal subunit